MFEKKDISRSLNTKNTQSGIDTETIVRINLLQILLILEL